MYLFFLSVYKAQSFLIPLVIAIILSMVMLPVSKKFEKWKLSRGWAVFLADLLIIAFLSGMSLLLGLQIKSVAEDWPEYQKKLTPKLERVDNFVKEKTGISLQQKFEEKLNQTGRDSTQTSKDEGNMNSQQSTQIPSGVGQAFSATFGFLGNTLLVFVYVFFFMYYREKFSNSILMFFKESDRRKVADTLDDFAKIAQNYMFGRFILIVLLAILYATGLSIIGIKHAIIISILAAFLSLLPYIGNVVGFFLAALMAILVEGGIESLLGVVIVFSIAQFVESYFLEPFVIGHKVNLNPVMVIIGVVAGGALWGVAGMIIAIPVLGIFKIIFDRVPALNPVGYMLGEEDIDSEEPGIIKKIKEKFKKIFTKK
jgi:predicted PurR-regulated permease PerM